MEGMEINAAHSTFQVSLVPIKKTYLCQISENLLHLQLSIMKEVKATEIPTGITITYEI